MVGGVEECGGKGKLCARAFKHKMCIPEKKVRRFPTPATFSGLAPLVN